MLLFDLIENIKCRLQKGLPGESFQYKMAPVSRPKSDFYIKNKIVPKKRYMQTEARQQRARLRDRACVMIITNRHC